MQQPPTGKRRQRGGGGPRSMQSDESKLSKQVSVNNTRMLYSKGSNSILPEVHKDSGYM